MTSETNPAVLPEWETDDRGRRMKLCPCGDMYASSCLPGKYCAAEMALASLDYREKQAAKAARKAEKRARS